MKVAEDLKFPIKKPAEAGFFIDAY